MYPRPLHFLGLLIEVLNPLWCRIDIGNINIARRAESIPDYPAPVVYPFITALAVGAAGAVSI